MTPRETQIALVRALDDFDQTRFAPLLEALRVAVQEHNDRAKSLHDHFRLFPEAATRPALAKHPIFPTVQEAVKARLGRREL